LQDFDVIVIGGGINGLTTAAYLSKAGLRTAVIERRHVIGTHCSTEEVGIPGVRHNLHASAIMAGVSPVLEDLELERYGLEMLGGEWNFLHPFKDGTAFLAHSYNPNITYKTISRFSKKDAEAYKKIVNGMNKHLGTIMPHYFTPPSVEAQQRFLGVLKQIPEIPSGFEEMNGYDVVNEFFEDERVKTALIGYELAIGPKARDKFIGATGVFGTFLENSGPLTAFTTRGGSSNLPKSLERCILVHGGTIMENCEVEKIIIKDGKAVAVRLSRSSAYPEVVIPAKRAIVSNLTAVPTFLNLVGEEYLDHSAVKALKSFNYEGQTLFTVVYSTSDVLHWKAANWDRNVDDAYWFHYGAECLKDVQKHETDLLEGRITRPIVSVGGSFLFTKRDPTQAPPGLHNITTWVNVPYYLEDGGAEAWDKIRDEVGQEITKRIDEFTVGFEKSIVSSVSYSPLEIYRRNPSSIEANFCGGNLKLGQLYLDRPFLGCGAPRTPIKNLYISNSIWPQSGSHLPTGYIAACVVAEDLGVRNKSWWTHEPLGWFRKWVRRTAGIEWNPFVSASAM
jgi:beta-carotene ketolase (CrtO type)